MRKFLATGCILSVMVGGVPAFADPPAWAPAHGRRAKDAERAPVIQRAPDRDRDDTYVVRRETVIYRADDGHYYCRRSDGTTGLIVGAAVGGLIGNQLARGKSAPLDTLLSAAGGALIGQQIDKGSVHCQ
jgi:uncharacterized protein YcfJ